MARKSDAVSGNCLVAASLEFIENKVASYFTSGFHPDLPAMCIGLAVIIIMLLWPKKWNSKVPSSLAALIMVLIFNHFAGLDIAVVGEIPKTLFLDERLSLSGFSISRFWDFFVPAFSIAALAMIESLLCGASAGKMKHERINGDRELVAQGVGNIIIPLFGGVPATAAIARTSVAIKGRLRDETDRCVPCWYTAAFHVRAGSCHVRGASVGTGRYPYSYSMEDE